MKSQIFQRKDGSFTMEEFEGEVQNKSVIPAKYSPEDKYAAQRRKAKSSE